jgi:hypothetical protein
MKAQGRFISFLLVVNAFFGGYAAGLNSRHVQVVDPSLPPLPAPKKDAAEAKPKDAKKEEVKAEDKSKKQGKKEGKHHHKSDDAGGKKSGKKSHHS